MPCGCSAALRSLSHFFLLFPAFGQLMCPAPNFAHYFLRSTPFRFIHHPDNCLRSQVPQTAHKTMLQRHTDCFSKPAVHYTTFRPLRHSFTSVRRNPPAAICCCARLAATCCVTGHHLHKTHTYKAGALCHMLPLHCVSIATCGCFTGHASRWHSQSIPSFLLHSLWRRAALLRVVRFATQLSFFWLRAVLPATPPFPFFEITVCSEWEDDK